MHAFLHFQHHRPLVLRLRFSPAIYSPVSFPSNFGNSNSISTMSSLSSSLVLPSSVSLSKQHQILPFGSPEFLKNSSGFLGFKNGARGFSLKGLDKSRVSMSVAAVGSQTIASDALFQDYKPSCAFLFPGQGAQAVGMGAEAQKVPAAAELYKKANEILGFDLLDVCLNGPKEKLDSTVLSQPAIYVTSLAAVEVLRARDGGQQIIDSVDVTCGLSLGEYTALAFAGAFSFEDGLKLVKLRGEAMQDAADAAQSAMVSIIGLDSDKVQLLCDAANEEVDEANKVQIANFLCPGNYAVSGGLKGIEAVEAKAKSFKARMSVRLAVAGAFHTSFMEPAVSRLEAALAATEIRTPRIPVISNVDAQPHADTETIKQILARQVTSPVQWETTVKTLLSKGLKKSYELGPGKVIAGIVKRMDKGAELENIGA
ncbi:OLC1v1006343C3 [Oldenlandia corymbosa var. corymbosa]|uniref:OLC1v1006343C3 n=1 Tax=Oldenlandia corymbosa var. corymbosa TaxID=529605 RepID=A0AAV1DK42_OLDCO|nr:OLC1v1006343C3 [Oldenlandia corymbosa var. corymbosa]